MSKRVAKHRAQMRYNIPVIGHFGRRSIRYPSILEAARDTGISYHLIFESCIDKICSARGTQWEYENGRYWLRYRAQYIRQVRKYTKWTGFNG